MGAVAHAADGRCISRADHSRLGRGIDVGTDCVSNWTRPGRRFGGGRSASRKSAWPDSKHVIKGASRGWLHRQCRPGWLAELCNRPRTVARIGPAENWRQPWASARRRFSGCGPRRVSSRIDWTGILGGHLKTGHKWTPENRPTEQNQNKIIYSLGWGVWANIFVRLAPAVYIYCSHLSGGYGNAGMRPERRFSGRNGSGRREPLRKPGFHSGAKAINPRGLGTESPSHLPCPSNG